MPAGESRTQKQPQVPVPEADDLGKWTIIKQSNPIDDTEPTVIALSPEPRADGYKELLYYQFPDWHLRVEGPLQSYPGQRGVARIRMRFDKNEPMELLLHTAKGDDIFLNRGPESSGEVSHFTDKEFDEPPDMGNFCRLLIAHSRLVIEYELVSDRTLYATFDTRMFAQTWIAYSGGDRRSLARLLGTAAEEEPLGITEQDRNAIKALGY
jgi:hypothetical protein